MTGGMDNFVCPTYISSRSADVIISDVRPIKLKLEALRSINVLLDEFLYNLLSTAGSVSTDKLKTSLIKLLPTTLGKESILEAEVELKAYWERSPQPSPVNGGGINDSEQFDLQWSYELLRLKCEGYTTMNDTDEDEEAERRLNDRMVEAGGTFPPRVNMLPPAALYLTAILEHVCEHILTLISRVVARDSSRTIATVQDLFVALCEDDSMYSMFKTMKVYEQIESLSKTPKPRRSKSFTRSSGRGSPAPKTSPPSTEAVLSSSPSSTPARLRMSSESLKSSPTTVLPTTSGSSRTSLEKVKAARIFGRSSSDNGERRDGTLSEMTKVQSEGSINGSITSDLMEDAALQDEFDELMRSGATMKVSLTPDRLKTMEVFKAERKKQTTQNNGKPPTASEPKRGHPARRPSIRNVDAIVEDDEDSSPIPPSAQAPTSPPSSYLPPASRVRQTSLINTNSSAALAANLRARSVSVSAISSDAPKKKTEMPPPLPPSAKIQRSISAYPKLNGVTNGGPPRTRRVVRNRESLDLDEVMRGSDEEEEDDLPPAPLPRSTANGSLKPGYKKPHISQAARELIEFLDEGPPTEFGLSPANASMISFGSTKTSKSGRFRSMMSRLTIGGSKENLNGSGRFVLSDSPKTPKSVTHRTMYSPARSPPPPPPPFLQSSLSSKQSLPSIPGVIVATPPPPPPSIVPPTHASEPSTEEGSRSHSHSPSPSPAKPSRRISIVRKAVPTFDEERTVVTPPVIPAEDEPEQYPPSRSSSTVLRPINGYEHTQSFHQQQPTSATFSSNYTVSTTSSIPTSLPATENGFAMHDPSPKQEINGLPEAAASSSSIKHQSHSQREASTSSHAQDALPTTELQTLRDLLTVATTADECRLIVDMFLAKRGCLVPTSDSPSTEKLVPAPTSHPYTPAATSALTASETLEVSLVSLLLGESEDDEASVELTQVIEAPLVAFASKDEPIAQAVPGEESKAVQPPPQTPTLQHSWQGIGLL